MIRRPRTGWLPAVYLALVLAAAGIAGVRLVESAEMPGLAAIELVLLALPWSLGLGVAPLSRLGWPGMVAIVLVGAGLNAGLLWWAERGLRRPTLGRRTGRAA